MPIGISFFTFQATSYVIDIYNKKIKSADNVFLFANGREADAQIFRDVVVAQMCIDMSIDNIE